MTSILPIAPPAATLKYSAGPNMRNESLYAIGDRTAAKSSRLGDVIHAASAVSRNHATPGIAIAVWQVAQGQYELQPMSSTHMSAGVVLDPLQDAPGFVPEAMTRIDKTLAAIVGTTSFARFAPGNTAPAEKIIDGPPGVAYPAIPAILPRGH